MRKTHILAIAIIAGLTLPALGQDFFKPLQDAIEQLSPQPERRTTPRVRVPEETPPVPRERPAPEDLAGPAEADDTAPAVEDGAPAEVEAPAEAEPVLPRPRPEHEEEAEPAADEPAPVTEEETPAPASEAAAPAEGAHGADEGDRVYQTACPAVLRGLVEAEQLPPIEEGICQEQSPISVTGILSHGRMVKLSAPLTTNCEMASALPDWIDAVDSYAMATQKAQIETINAGTSYMCRNRNNAETGFTSEHGFADAADITGFTLSDGRTIAVEADWMPANSSEGRFLRYAHDAACSGFTTVLGPEANALHHDHFHLDLGCHGRSCTARICE